LGSCRLTAKSENLAITAAEVANFTHTPEIKFSFTMLQLRHYDDALQHIKKLGEAII